MKIREIIIFFGILLACLNTSYGQVQSKTYDAMLRTLLKHSVPEVSVTEVANQKGILFLDAREPSEYTVSHIRNAQHVGYESFDLTALKDIPKAQKIVVYCSVGYRSEKVAEKLLSAGFRDVANLYGGIFEWKNQNQPVVNQAGITEKVHAYSRTWGIWLKNGEKVY